MSAADAGRGRLVRLVPAVDWLTHYRRAWLRGDVLAALTTSTAALVAPVAAGDVAGFGALAIAVIGYAESATVAESLADEHGYTVRPDRELVAIGGANVLAGLFQGFITGGGASQSAANDRAGAQTQLVSLLVSGLTVLTAVALLPLFRDLPRAVLGAIVIGAVAGFLNLPALRRIARLRRDSFVLAMVALAGVLILGVLGGLLLAVVISILLLLNRQRRPGSSVLGRLPGTGAWTALDREPDARAEPGLLVFRLNAAPDVRAALEA